MPLASQAAASYSWNPSLIAVSVVRAGIADATPAGSEAQPRAGADRAAGCAVAVDRRRGGGESAHVAPAPVFAIRQVADAAIQLDALAGLPVAVQVQRRIAGRLEVGARRLRNAALALDEAAAQFRTPAFAVVGDAEHGLVR